MIQNTGELMMYIGGALVLVYPLGVLIINILCSSTKGRFRPTSTMGIVLGLCVVAWSCTYLCRRFLSKRY